MTKDAPINLPPHFFATLQPEDDNRRSIVEDYSEAYARATILADRAAASAEQDAPVAEVKRAGSRKAEFFSIALVCWASTCRH
jgi:hypothetical protein